VGIDDGDRFCFHIENDSCVACGHPAPKTHIK
jgi:ribosomal protein L37E